MTSGRHGVHRIVHLVGPPGAGKTTLARGLSDVRGFSVVESGSIVRDQLRAGDVRGFRRCPDGGLPDPRRITQLVLEAVRHAIHERCSDVIIEGFPRSGAQTRRWLEVLPREIQVVAIWLDAPDELVLIDRIMRRYVCSACGRPVASETPCLTIDCRGLPQRRTDAVPELERRRIGSHQGHLVETLAEFRRRGVDVISVAALQPAQVVLAQATEILDTNARARALRPTEVTQTPPPPQ